MSATVLIRRDKTMKRLAIYFLAAIMGGTALAQTPQITLNWEYTRGTVVETGFKVERKDGPIGSPAAWGVSPMVIGPSVRSVIDTTVTADKEYCYRINAISGTQTSMTSNTACGKAPATLQLLSATVKLGELSWNWTAPKTPKPTAKDWVGLFLDDQWVSDGWAYTNAAAKGTITKTPSKPGTYSFKYCLNDSAASCPIASHEAVVK